jgi:hypothetical protein
MSIVKAERRLAYDVSAINVSKITVHTEGSVGERVYLVELWGWKILFQPSIDYPFKPPKTLYLYPELDEWKQYNTLLETTTAQLTLEQLAMSIICDLTKTSS